MDRLLETLRSQGKMDSAGRFSLDAERGLALLARRHASEPYRGLLFAISGALLSGAEAVRVQLGLHSLIVRDDGPALSHLEVNSLFTHLVSRRHLRLHHLALALHTLSGTRFRALFYDTPTHRLIWNGKGFTVKRQTARRQGNQLTIRGYLPINPLRAALEIEQIILTVREKGRFVADRLMLNRSRVSRGIVLPADTPAAVELTHPGVPIRFQEPGARKASPGPFSGALWLKSQPSKTSEFILTEGGLELQWLSGPLGYPGWEAVIEAPHLERDLQGHVVINQGYRTFLQLLQNQAFELLEKVDFPDRLRPPFLGQLHPARAGGPAPGLQAEGPVSSKVQISWDGRFAVLPRKNSLSVVEVATGSTTLRLPPVGYRADRHGDFAVCPGTSVISQIDPNSRKWVDSYDCRSGELQSSYRCEHELTGLAFSADGMTLFLFLARQAVLSLDTATGREAVLYDGSTGREWDVCHGFPSPDGSRLALQLAHNRVVLLELDSGRAYETVAREFCDWGRSGDRFLARTAMGYGWLGLTGQLLGASFRPQFLGSRVQVGPNDQVYCFLANQAVVYEYGSEWQEMGVRQGTFACLNGYLVELETGRLRHADQEIVLEQTSRRLDWSHPRWLCSITRDGGVEVVDLEQASSQLLPGVVLPSEEAPPPPPDPPFHLRADLEAGQVEVYGPLQPDPLVSYQVQNASDPLIQALACDPWLAQRCSLCLHPSGRWTIRLHRGAQGVHVLACYPSHLRRAVSAAAIDGVWSAQVALAFSHSGRHLAVQVGQRLSVYSFAAESGELAHLQSLLLTMPSWCWSGEVLHPYPELDFANPAEPDPPPSTASPTSLARAAGSANPTAAWPLVDCLPGCDRRDYSPGGLLVSQSSDQLIVWELESGRPLWSLDRPRDWCLCSQGAELAVVSEADLHCIDFYSLGTGAKLRSHRHPEPLHGLVCPPGSGWLLLIEWRSEMPVLLEVETGDREPLAPEDRTYCDRPLHCSLSPDGHWLALEGQRYLHIFDLPARSLSRTLEGCKLLGWSGDSSRMLTRRGRQLELRCLRQAEPSLRDHPALLTDRHQLNLHGDWVLYRVFEPDQATFVWQGRRAGVAGLTLTLQAEQVAQAAGQIAWTRGAQVFLADFPIFQARSAQLAEPSRHLELKRGALSSLSVYDRIQHWHPTQLREYPQLGQPLARGRRAQVCTLSNGLLVRSSRALTVWDFAQDPEVRPHQGWALATLQQCQGRIVHHAGGESGCQVLDDEARLLWSAAEVHLLNQELALSRSDPSRKPQVVEAGSGNPLFQPDGWPEHIPLQALAPSPGWNLNRIAELKLTQDCSAILFIPTSAGLIEVSRQRVSLMPGELALPLSQHLAWHCQHELFVSVYPGAEGGCRLCTYNLRTDRLEAGPAVDYVPVGGPRLNQDGTRVALQVLNRIYLSRLDPASGRLEAMPPGPFLPPGCGWGWLGDRLAIWRANWLQLHDQDGRALFRVYLRLNQAPLVVNAQGPCSALELRLKCG